MILVVDMNWKRDSLGYYEFVMPILEVVKPFGSFMVKHYLDVTSQDLNRCDWLFSREQPSRTHATLGQPEKFRWLKETEKTVLGICAGMQTIGLIYGAALTRCLEIGMTPIKVVKENPLVSGDFKAYSLHSVCIQPTADFEVWAESAKCVQIIKHKSRSIYGTLFHPEVRNQEILKKFVETQKNRK